jgi:hypothetical protein
MWGNRSTLFQLITVNYVLPLFLHVTTKRRGSTGAICTTAVQATVHSVTTSLQRQFKITEFELFLKEFHNRFWLFYESLRKIIHNSVRFYI